MGTDFFILITRLKSYLPVSILASLIFFGTTGIIIGYNFKNKLPWGLIILVGIIRLLAGTGIHGLNIYEALISLAILAVFIDLGISFKIPQNYS
ncbi:hypothetical protein [Halanaerobacter jeridensis]|uniref:hypothetical protein n=1 Tax=Halanaerobacter jeridensis TaxID=706427 RepID=UPI00195880A4|nr:hypothetical protein [Halanaerobacter jeridensis]